VLFSIRNYTGDRTNWNPTNRGPPAFNIPDDSVSNVVWSPSTPLFSKTPKSSVVEGQKISKGNHVFYSLDKLKLKTKNQIFCCWHFDFVIHLKKEDKKPFFPLLKNVFLSPPYSKCIKKVVEFSFTPTKNILVSSYWFQFIQRIEHKCLKNTQKKCLI
jgi:hypothetical protein